MLVVEDERKLAEAVASCLRQTYDDLLHAATQPVRADLLMLGELNYAGPLVAEVTGIPWASYVLAPLSFFSAFDPPVSTNDNGDGLALYDRMANRWVLSQFAFTSTTTPPTTPTVTRRRNRRRSTPPR